jgi:hypothetical protein
MFASIYKDVGSVWVHANASKAKNRCWPRAGMPFGLKPLFDWPLPRHMSRIPSRLSNSSACLALASRRSCLELTF